MACNRGLSYPSIPLLVKRRTQSSLRHITQFHPIKYSEQEIRYERGQRRTRELHLPLVPPLARFAHDLCWASGEHLSSSLADA